MGQSFLAWTVETLDASHHSPHRLAEFARLGVAVKAARRALDDERVSLAIVRDRAGIMVYATDRRRQWSQPSQNPETGLRDSAESDSFSLGGTGQPEPDVSASLSAYRRQA